eukprot:XP_020407968.1 vegetative cell wall protein gp1-like [Zea mays]
MLRQGLMKLAVYCLTVTDSKTGTSAAATPTTATDSAGQPCTSTIPAPSAPPMPPQPAQAQVPPTPPRPLVPVVPPGAVPPAPPPTAPEATATNVFRTPKPCRSTPRASLSGPPLPPEETLIEEFQHISGRLSYSRFMYGNLYPPPNFHSIPF